MPPMPPAKNKNKKEKLVNGSAQNAVLSKHFRQAPLDVNAIGFHSDRN